LVFVGYAFWRRQAEADVRPALISAAVVVGTFTSAITEALSLANGLTTAAIGLCWTAATGAAVAALRLWPPAEGGSWPRRSKPPRFPAIGVALVVPLLGVLALTSLVAS